MVMSRYECLVLQNIERGLQVDDPTFVARLEDLQSRSGGGAVRSADLEPADGGALRAVAFVAALAASVVGPVLLSVLIAMSA
ncbi:DUF3040 domain-containing protein [Spirillospora sp. NPDC127200]